MCKEYDRDNSHWDGVTPEDLNDDGTLNERYKTFALWF
jgi:hypothetical protein